jgi:hypothetical protein
MIWPHGSDVILAPEANQIHNKQAGGDRGELMQDDGWPAFEETVHQSPQDLRKRNVHGGKNKRTEHIEVKDGAVWAVIADKFAE